MKSCRCPRLINKFFTCCCVCRDFYVMIASNIVNIRPTSIQRAPDIFRAEASNKASRIEILANYIRRDPCLKAMSVLENIVKICWWYNIFIHDCTEISIIVENLKKRQGLRLIRESELLRHFSDDSLKTWVFCYSHCTKSH